MIDEIFAQWDKRGSPGFALAVIREGESVYRRGYGIADLDHDIPIAPDSVFHAASLAKQFTAMAVLLLVNDGRLSLADDARTYLPELPDFGVPITIRHLLQHTSGIRDQWVLVTMAGWRLSDDVVREEDVLHFVSRMRALNFRPGDQFLYSNTGYTLAALIVKRVSGLSLRDFAEARIFRPLGMTRSQFRDAHGLVVADHAYGYRVGPDDAFELRMPNYDLVGPTNLLTTVEDLARWEHNFYHQALGGEAVDQMQQPGTLTSGQSIPYGLGLFVSTYRGQPIVEHDGRDAGYRAHLIRFPELGFAIACLCNLAVPDGSLPGRLARKVVDLYLVDRLGPPPGPDGDDPVPAPRADIGALVGAYWSASREEVARVWVDGSTLQLGLALDAGPLLPLGANRFRWRGQLQSADVEFLLADNGQPAGLLLWAEAWIAMTPADATPEAMAEYEGLYHSEEIETTYDVRVGGSWLVIARQKYPPTALTPVFRDAFALVQLGLLRFGTLRFTRDAQQRITGFLIGGDRLRSFRFVRTA